MHETYASVKGQREGSAILRVANTQKLFVGNIATKAPHAATLGHHLAAELVLPPAQKAPVIGHSHQPAQNL